MENAKTNWTLFWDMHSGGGTKEGSYNKIYIEASDEEAKIIFYNRFGHNPERVSCTCCGEDYSISTEKSFKECSRYHRNCAWSKKSKGYIEEPNSHSSEIITVDEYIKHEDVLVVYDKDIKDSERSGEVPSEGYVWM